MNIDKLRAAYDDIPPDNGFYQCIDRWAAVYEGRLGDEVPVDVLYDFDPAPETSVPLIQYYAPNIANNKDTAQAQR